MRKLLFVLLIALVPFVAYAGSPAWNLMIAEPAAGGGDECAGYLICQNLENTGYDHSETWAETTGGTNGTVNEDYATSPAPLRGAQSLFVKVDSFHLTNTTTSPSYTTASPCYVHFLLRFQGGQTDHTDFMYLLGAADAVQATLKIRNATNYLNAVHGVTSTIASTTAISTSTTYHVWVDYTLGAGTDGVMTVRLSTDGTKPTGTPEISITTGTALLGINKIKFLTGYSADFIFDQILVSSAEFTTVPN